MQRRRGGVRDRGTNSTPTFRGRSRPKTRSCLAANNYASSLIHRRLFEEAKTLLRKAVPVAQRANGESTVNTLRMRTNYARALYEDPGATLADLREAVTTLEDTERIARRTLGGAHPLAAWLSGIFLRKVRAALRARETPSGEA